MYVLLYMLNMYNKFHKIWTNNKVIVFIVTYVQATGFLLILLKRHSASTVSTEEKDSKHKMAQDGKH